MNLTLKWDQSKLDYFAGEAPKRFAYATDRALTNTVKRIQQAEFARARSAFTIRKEKLFFGSAGRPGGLAARITQFPSARKGIFWAEITAGNDDKGRASKGGPILYTGFEAGFERKPFTPGAKNVAVPITGGARPTKASAVTPAFTFAKMRLAGYKGSRRLTRNTRSRKNLSALTLLGEYGVVRDPVKFDHVPGSQDIQYKGANRTYVSFSKRFPLGAVFQRTGSGAKGGRLLWAFERPWHQAPVLEFVRTAESIASKYFAEETEAALQDALQHDALKAVRLAGA